MGFMTQADFSTEVQSALGDKGYDDTRVTRWVNWGYLDVASAISFEVLESTDLIPTVAATATIAAPTEKLLIRFVRDQTNDRLLTWITKNEYFRLKQATQGQPLKWAQHIGNIHLHPIPDDEFSMMVGSKSTPTLLTGSTTTVLPDSWDQVILMLAVQYGLLHTGEEQRAAVWMSRAVAYAMSRITEEDLKLELPGLKKTIGEGKAFSQQLAAAQQ